MEVTIVDLEEFTKKKAVYAKLGDYKINVNDVPVQVALKVNEYHNNIRTGESVDIGLLIDEVVIPVIKRTNEDLTKEDILNKFSYDQIMKVMNMIFDCFFSAGTEPKKEDNKKKRLKVELIKLLAHLANCFGWTEEYMLSMSLSRLMLYYTASFQLPYTIEYETYNDGNITETQEGNKKIKREKQGLWEVETITIDN